MLDESGNDGSMGAEMITDLRQRIQFCHDCNLRDGCILPVPFSGSPEAKILIVGEAPGNQEDSQNKPFVGQSGDLLFACLGEFGIDRKHCMVMNTVCCRPPENRKPTKKEIDACSLNFTAQHMSSMAQAVLVLGATALRKFRPRVKISDAHGRFFVYRQRMHYATFHPSAALRSVSYSKPFQDDIRRFAEWSKSMNDQGWVSRGLPCSGMVHAAMCKQCGPVYLTKRQRVDNCVWCDGRARNTDVRMF